MRDDLEYVMAGTEAEMLQGGFQRRGAGAPEAGTDDIHHGFSRSSPALISEVPPTWVLGIVRAERSYQWQARCRRDHA